MLDVLVGMLGGGIAPHQTMGYLGLTHKLRVYAPGDLLDGVSRRQSLCQIGMSKKETGVANSTAKPFAKTGKLYLMHVLLLCANTFRILGAEMRKIPHLALSTFAISDVIMYKSHNILIDYVILYIMFQIYVVIYINEIVTVLILNI